MTICRLVKKGHLQTTKKQNKTEKKKSNFKTKFLFETDRKHCGKRRKCWLPAFSPFVTVFSKGFLNRAIKNCDCVEKG